MNNGPAIREPPKPKAILATPLNVEESRAQRQQRSQARFRDRGGIFVPSNRNTLADILLGKAEPLKKPRRSVSASPLGHLQKGPSVTKLRRISSPTKRTTPTPASKGSRSPQKQSRKSNHGGGRETIIEWSHSRSPQKPAASASTVKPKAKPAAKPPKAKILTRSKKSLTEDESGHETDAAPSKSKPKTKSKAPSKSSKFLPEVLEETEDGAVPLKSKGKATKSTKAAKTKVQKPLDKPIDKHKPKSSKPPPKSSNLLPDAAFTEVASSSTASRPITKPRRSRTKTSDLYSGASEDEYAPKPSKSRQRPKSKAHASTTKSSTSDKAKGTAKPPPKQTKASGHLSDIVEEDEGEEEEAPPTRNWSPPRQISAKNSKASTSENPKRVEPTKGRKHSAQDVSEDEEPRQPSAKRTKAVMNGENQVKQNAKSKSGSKATASEAVKGKKRSAREDDSELDDPQPPTKRSKAALDKELSSKPTPKSRSKAANAITKGKKHRIPEEDESLEEPDQPPAKRAKATVDDKTISSSNSKTAPSKIKATLREGPARKKRPLDQDDNVASEKADKRSSKRKKPLSENEDGPETIAKAPVKGLKAKKGDSRSKKPPNEVANLSSSSKATETGRLKENISGSGKAAANAVSNKRGPPKSVLERLKAGDEPHIIDNDPDPIDFLS